MKLMFWGTDVMKVTWMLFFSCKEVLSAPIKNEWKTMIDWSFVHVEHQSAVYIYIVSLFCVTIVGIWRNNTKHSPPIPTNNTVIMSCHCHTSSMCNVTVAYRHISSSSGVGNLEAEQQIFPCLLMELHTR